MTAVEVRTRGETFALYVLPETDVLYRVARTLTGQPADAEDLVQETLLRAYRSMDRFDGRHPRAWLLTILRNVEHNRHRRQRPQLLDDPERVVEIEDGDCRHDDGNPEHLVVDRCFAAEVEAAFKALHDKYREVVAIVDVEGCGYSAAAEALGIPIGTVMSRLHRARRRIRRQLSTTSSEAGAR
ncbi:MAG: sigma-70 family RNA polymerase sigma factor [Catenulispora sp.]|nr:sigma-70 family RNA polymerase sigma factor [Catenulispora sp.]